MEHSGPLPPEHDIVLLLEACAARLGDDMLARVRSDLGADIRFRDGYVFQHLIEQPLAVSDLARRLGVTQQAASKQVADLKRRGLVSKKRDPADGRSSLVSLTARGERAIESSRRARSNIAMDLCTSLDEPTYQALVTQLAKLSDEIGAIQHLMDRNVRPEDSR